MSTPTTTSPQQPMRVMSYNEDTSDMTRYSAVFGNPPLEKAAAKSKLKICLNVYQTCSAEQSVAVLDNILICLMSISHSGHSTSIAGPAVDACVQKLALVLEHDLAPRAVTTAWRIMVHLINHQTNSSASAYNLLSAISADEALRSRLHCAAAKHLALSTAFITYHPPADACLSYLGAFSAADGARQIILGQTPDLIKFLVATCTTFKSHLVSQGIFSTLTNLLGRSVLTDTHNAVEFFNVGGFAAVQKSCKGQVELFLECVLASNSRECEELRTLCRVFTVLRTMYDIYRRVQSHLPPGTITQVQSPLPPGAITLVQSDTIVSCDTVLELAQHLHKVLSRSQYPELLKPVVMCVISAVDFLRARPVEDSLKVATVERFLLYASSASMSDCIMVWVVKWSRSAIFSKHQQLFGEFFGICANLSPRFQAAAESELSRSYNFPTATPTVTVSDDYRHCNYPSCGVCSDTTLQGPRSLKKCSHCESVSYCGREHQKADWKAHKKDCVKL
jgi:hypothetical protein